MADFPVTGVDPEVDHESVVREWQVPSPQHPASVVDPASGRVLLRVEQPQFSHNAGALSFGPDGMLYIALGDGGGVDDQGPGHSPQGNGQDPSNILGNILRIDPRGTNAANGQYGVPRDNPFWPGDNGPVGGEIGCGDGFCDEIYAWGFRNPFRFSLDRATGALIAADVGQNRIEEINLVTAGNNYGWRIKEGSFCFDPNGEDPSFVTDGQCGSPDLIDPIAEYDRDEGIAVIGGFVYRGSEIPELEGRYVFGDYSRAFTPSAVRLFYLTGEREVRELELDYPNEPGLFLLGFGEDAAGELFVLANANGMPSGETGVVLKMVRARDTARALGTLRPLGETLVRADPACAPGFVENLLFDARTLDEAGKMLAGLLAQMETLTLGPLRLGPQALPGTAQVLETSRDGGAGEPRIRGACRCPARNLPCAADSLPADPGPVSGGTI